MRFLHTSDWHIGRSFHNVSLLEDQTFILHQIIDIAKQQQVNAILIAGDIYDRSVPPAAAVALLDEVIDRIIVELGIALIIIPGNHDSSQRLGFASRQLQHSGLYILGDINVTPEPVILQDDIGEVAFWGLPYADPAMVRSVFKSNDNQSQSNDSKKCEINISEQISTHDQGIKVLCDSVTKCFKPAQRNVVLSHCFIDGASESESERPLSIGGADRVSWQHFDQFDYVALGHLHGRQFKGKENIRYSGSPLKYSFSEENHIKSVTIVNLNADSLFDIEQIPLKPLRNMRSITGKLADILVKSAIDTHSDDYLLVKLEDEHAMLDVMGKLREVYPNILHLERPGLMALKSAGVQPKQLNANELSMFSDFFSQVMNRELNKDEQDVIQDVIDKLHTSGEQL
jgi:exonuclease SbcD